MPNTRLIQLNPTIIATPYTSGATIGGLMVLQDVPPRGIVRDVEILIDGTITPAMDLYFFNQLPASIADNAAFTQSHAEQIKRVTGDKIAVASADYVTENSKTRAAKVAVNRDYVASALANYGYGLWLFAVANGTPTFPSTSALKFNILLWGQ